MKVLIINTNAYSGSIGNISAGLYRYLKKNGHKAKACYRGINEKKTDNKDFIPLISNLEFCISLFFARLTGLESHFGFFSTRKLKRIIDIEKPDVVQLYNIHGNYIRANTLLEYLKRKGTPVVYSMLDEYPYMGKCAYPITCNKFKTECKKCPQKNKYPESWFFDMSSFLFHEKEKCYRNFNHIVFTGPPYVCERANESFLLRNQRVVDLMEPFNFDYYYYPRDISKLRKDLGIHSSDRVILCASGTYFRKGGQYFVDLAKKLQNVSDMRFIFVGYDRDDWTFPDNVIVKGRIDNQDNFAEYISIADAYVCTFVGDTTPSVCLCALGCGTPIIGFDYGGVRDCAPDKYGTYVPIGNIDALADAVSKVKKKSTDEIKNIRNYAISRFSQDVVYSKQLKIYESLIKKI